MAAMIHEQDGWIFVWRGGTYIDIHANGDFNTIMLSERPLIPWDTIDVWDRVIDKPSIRWLQDFEAECQKWLDSREWNIHEETAKNVLNEDWQTS